MRHSSLRRARFPALVLAIAGVFMLVACGGDDDDADASGSVDNGDGAGEEPVATTGDLEIYAPAVRFTLGDNAAGYFTVRNTGEEDDRLVSASSDAAGMVQIHETATEGGSSTMQQIEDGITIPAGGEVTLTQGERHVMMMEMGEPLEDGDEVTLTLTFENAGEVSFTVPASQLGGGNADDEAEHSDDDK